ncbi:MAG TPA: DUF2807 domain-containing protein [Allosphingosinicella sp.]|uniref:GIN domain-containing protein n=1 Tax=Allosphingosinicella sp. TaxID=2823234 RepID=UPI002EDB6440
MEARILLAAVAITAAPLPLNAQTNVAVPQFEKIELRGGGTVRVRHGAQQRVTLIKGSTQYTSFDVVRSGGNGGADQLVIRACNEQCPQRYDLEIEVVTPDVDGLAIKGGGSIDVVEGFPRQSALAAAIHGGGQIDARALPASSVAAAVNGGGSLMVRPASSLAAAVRGGGLIRYWGNPSVTQTVQGGGSIQRQ